MAKQRDLLGLPSFVVTPDPGRSEPRLWVRRLVIWRDRGDVLRDIRFRAGLNIVWSPDSAELSTQKAPITLGHGSGKTLLCRLIRYVLGEERFADDDVRHRIASAYESAEVGAEVVIDGALWSVVRPLGRGRRHLAVVNSPLDELATSDLQSTGIEPFVAAVEEQVLTRAVADLVSERPGVAWRIVLAWLSRDQECRFDHLLDWRRKESESKSPAMSADRIATIRAMIGAIVPDELSLQSEAQELRNRRDALKRDAADRDRDIARIRERLASELGVIGIDGQEGPIGTELLRAAARRKLAAVANVDPAADLSNLSAVREGYEGAVRRTADLAGERRVVAEQMTTSQAQIDRLRAELPGLTYDLKMAETPVCPVCRVPISDVLAEGCKISLDKSKLETARQRYENGQRQLAKWMEAVTSARERQTNIEEEHRQAERAAIQLREFLRAAERAQDAHDSAWYEARAHIDQVSRLSKLLEADEVFLSEVESLDHEIAERSQRLSAFRGQQAGVFEALSRFFDGIIGGLVPGARGITTLDGNGIQLSVQLGGDRSTVAMTSLKVLAFDLAVLCMSIEGRIPLPAFFIHDSPREADMGLGIYQQIFESVRALEQRDERASFQYIITTTTAPPPGCDRQPWVVATLRGLPAEERLLRTDL